MSENETKLVKIAWKASVKNSGNALFCLFIRFQNEITTDVKMALKY